MAAPSFATSGDPLVVTPARWPQAAQAAVCLMVDDLTDGWIDVDGRGQPRGPNDWGHRCDLADGSFAFLRDGFLREFPEARVTFFVPVDRLPDIAPGAHDAHFTAIDQRPAFAEFLRSVAADPRLECAYHGSIHGIPGPMPSDYRPEFETYRSLDAAVEGLERGLEIWRRVFGERPRGGKYPAYAGGPFGDEAIDRVGFRWWCRRWDRDLAGAHDPALVTPRLFGNEGVIDLPSTLDGGFLTRPQHYAWTPRALVGVLIHPVRVASKLTAQIEGIVRAGGVVTVQEHITWARPDRLRQTPNVRDDATSLRLIFRALRRYPLWHATCGEIADYAEAWSRTSVRGVARDAFALDYAGRAKAATLALLVSGPPAGDELVFDTADGPLRARVALKLGPRSVVTEPVALTTGTYRLLAPPVPPTAA